MLSASAAQAFEVENCNYWQEKANTFMTWRQQGTPITQAVKQVEGNRSRGLLLQAYAEPKAEGLEAQYKAIQDFTNKIYSDCIKHEKADN
jgi:hypothetical protein